MPNHFHFLVRIKDRQPSSNEDWQNSNATVSRDGQPLAASKAFANLFGTYTKACTKAFHRTGSLFEKPFRRVLDDSDRSFIALVSYFHRNPQKNGFVDDCRKWPHSSYRTALSGKTTLPQRSNVLAWFDDPAGFQASHLVPANESAIKPLIAGDF